MNKWIGLLIFRNPVLEVTVKLYGTLSRPFDGYDHRDGLGVCIPDSSCVHDLLVQLNLDSRKIGIISMDGRPVNEKTPLKEGARIKIFQPIFGG